MGVDDPGGEFPRWLTGCRRKWPSPACRQIVAGPVRGREVEGGRDRRQTGEREFHIPP